MSFLRAEAAGNSVVDDDRHRRQTCLRTIWITAIIITLARLAYNAWLSPYELVADEAQYWDWSRRFDWSYYSKGPGIAWLIAASTRVFGNAEWAIRVPAAVSFGVVMVALGGLTVAALGHGPRGLHAAALVPAIVTLVPAYQLSALLMTIDAPYIACWTIALCAGWDAYRRERQGRPRATPWIAIGAAIGVGFLFKYTALLLIPGLLAFAWMERRSMPWRQARFRALAAVVTLVAAMMPVLIWNARHDAATTAHLLGYLRTPGGDRPASRGLALSPIDVGQYIVVQLAVFGPALALAIAGARAVGRTREGGEERAFARFAICAAVPTLAVFLVASLRTPIAGNWPIAAYTSLVPLAAISVAAGVGRGWWRGAVLYGAVTLVAIHWPLAAAHAPGIGRFVPVHRFHGARAQIELRAAPIQEFLGRTERRGLIIATSHNHAALAAYYLPMHPHVASAGQFLGDRRSAYDFFPDTDLGSPALAGRPALFIGGTAAQWTAAFDCPDLTVFSSDGPMFMTTRFVPQAEFPR